jgi:hypothetical protein
MSFHESDLILDHLQGKVDSETYGKVSGLVNAWKTREDRQNTLIQSMALVNAAQNNAFLALMPLIIPQTAPLFTILNTSPPSPYTSMQDLPLLSTLSRFSSEEDQENVATAAPVKKKAKTHRRHLMAIENTSLPKRDKIFRNIHTNPSRPCPEGYFPRESLEFQVKNVCKDGMSYEGTAAMCPNACGSSFVIGKNWISNMRKHLNNNCTYILQSENTTAVPTLDFVDTDSYSRDEF